MTLEWGKFDPEGLERKVKRGPGVGAQAALVEGDEGAWRSA